jgi:hypothetical protein
MKQKDTYVFRERKYQYNIDSTVGHVNLWGFFKKLAILEKRGYSE